ncbi:unnamed protein product, partial [Discosporangium mesarthrocarpum]
EAALLLPPPPKELYAYVRAGTRAGVLAALGTAQRSEGRPLGTLLVGATSLERDSLRAFLAREPPSEMTPEEVAVCQALPMLPLHGDGLRAAMALCGGMLEVPHGGETAATEQYAASNQRQLFILRDGDGDRVLGAGEDPRVRNALEGLAFVPVGGKLLRARDVFDPEIAELSSLLPPTHFPDPTFTDPLVLSALRPLGLRVSLDWNGIVAAAASVAELA